MRETRLPRFASVATGALLALLSAVACAQSESSPYAPLFQRAIITALGADCAKAHPDLAEGIAKQRAEWLESQADVLAGIDAQVAALPEDRKTALAQLIGQAQANLHKNFGDLVATPDGRKGCQELPATFGSAGPAMYDAENLGEATGMYHQMILLVGLAAPACSKRFPATSEAIVAAQANWRAREKLVIARVEQERARLKAQDKSQFQLLDASQNQAARDSLESVLQSGAAQAFCEQFFVDLGSGNGRRKTPKVYEFLEAK